VSDHGPGRGPREGAGELDAIPDEGFGHRAFITFQTNASIAILSFFQSYLLGWISTPVCGCKKKKVGAQGWLFYACVCPLSCSLGHHEVEDSGHAVCMLVANQDPRRMAAGRRVGSGMDEGREGGKRGQVWVGAQGRGRGDVKRKESNNRLRSGLHSPAQGDSHLSEQCVLLL
jgi:hypothetical protein